MLNNINKTRIFYTGLFIVVAIGIWFRLKGLGKWPLAVDEYYIVKSIENILKFGIPQFEGGGYYDRGILYQYLTSFLILIGVKTEFAARIIPVISSILVIPPIYLIAKKVTNNLAAFSITVLISFSLWEIEFARFARMYAPFQAIFIWYIYFLLGLIFEDKNSNWKWLFILSIIAIFTYEGSVFLLILNFLPFAIKRKIEIKQFTISSLLILLTFYYIKFDFRTLGQNDLLPQIAKDYLASLPASGGLIKIPMMLVNVVFENIYFGLGFITVCLITLYSLFLISKHLHKSKYQLIFFTILFALTILNQFGLALIFFLLLILSNWIDLKKTNKKTLIYVSLIISLHLILWFIFTLFTTSWYSFYPEFEPLTYLDTIKRVFVLFFNYPGIYTTFWLYYVTMPLYTFITIAIISIGLFLSLRNTLHNNLAIRFLYLLVILIFLIVSYLIAGVETRYSFFIYPVVLLLVVISIYLISELIFRQKNYRNIFTLISLIFFMFFTEDYDYSHAFNIDEPEYNFRENYNDMLKRHFYRRYDIRTPAEYVNKNINPNEIVIVNEMVLEYYLKKVDYIFIEYKSRRFPILSTKNGKKERWTNSDLIYEKKSLVEMLNNSKKTIWFVVHKLPYIQKPLLEIEFYEKFENYLVYQSIDNMVNVYKIDKKGVKYE